MRNYFKLIHKRDGKKHVTTWFFTDTSVRSTQLAFDAACRRKKRFGGKISVFTTPTLDGPWRDVLQVGEFPAGFVMEPDPEDLEDAA